MSLALSEECVRQARVYWKRRFGEVLGVRTFKQYLYGTDAVQGILEIPERPQEYPDYLARVVLVDGRVFEKVGLVEFCRLCGIKYAGKDNTFVPHDPARVRSGLRWMYAQSGRRNRNVPPNVCRTEHSAPHEVGLEHVEGISLYVQDVSTIEGHLMGLSSSESASGRRSACLGMWHQRPELLWCPNEGDLCPLYGSASRGD